MKGDRCIKDDQHPRCTPNNKRWQGLSIELVHLHFGTTFRVNTSRLEMICYYFASAELQRMTNNMMHPKENRVTGSQVCKK
mmetsp:Transcript_1038/g.1882  ORF Transcript_1038/g.1882 Transcript_1038/m.1882 type:complete len:81 (-) Transcript_1038:42-284(-)